MCSLIIHESRSAYLAPPVSGDCPGCGSEAVRWSDSLGRLLWSECRDCGTVYSVPNGRTEGEQ